MTRHAVFFLLAFALGAAAALAVRAALFKPHADRPAQMQAPSRAPMVDNAPPRAETPAAAAEAHAERGACSAGSLADASPASTVNSVCAICGMDVNPEIPPALYRGQRVGFGCRTCPPKFAADPDRYGPSALRNKLVED